MSRNKYDSSTGTLTQIGGWQGVDNALSDSSENPVQNKILKGVLDKAYKDDDTAETAIADGDYFPYYDVSASAKRKTLWSNIISKLKNVFATTTTVAPIETTTTASRAYTTGQQFILNGILYRATANISSGGTINTGSGGNATTAADVTSQISNFTPVIYNNYSDFLVPDSKISSINYIYGYRVDKRVRLVFVCNIGDSAISAWTTAFSMKPFFTPKVGATGFVMRVTSSVSVNTGIVNISTYGGAQCNTNLLATGAYLFVLDYIVS